MAVGDPIFIKQEAQPTPGTTPYFNYTTTVDMVITGWITPNFSTNGGTWVDSVSGYYQVLESSSLTSVFDPGARSRLLLETGQVLTVTSNNVNRFGLMITGFEI